MELQNYLSGHTYRLFLGKYGCVTATTFIPHLFSESITIFWLLFLKSFRKFFCNICWIRFWNKNYWDVIYSRAAVQKPKEEDCKFNSVLDWAEWFHPTSVTWIQLGGSLTISLKTTQNFLKTKFPTGQLKMLQKKVSGKWTKWSMAFHTCNKIIWFEI